MSFRPDLSLLGCTALALGPLFPAFNLRDIQAVVVSMMILFEQEF
jgi:hypothetical protein